MDVGVMLIKLLVYVKYSYGFKELFWGMLYCSWWIEDEMVFIYIFGVVSMIWMLC